MKALLQKEMAALWRESLIAGLLGAAGLCALGRSVLDYGPPHMHYDEGGKVWALFCLVTGAAMGFWPLRQERTGKTQAYLHHRATGARGAFGAKVLAGLACLALILALELGLHAAWFALFSDVGHLARWGRALDHLALASLLVSSYALGLWSSSLPRSEGMRLVALLIGACSLYYLAALVSLRWDLGPEPPTLLFVAVQLALAVLLGGLAVAVHTAEVEPDRPLKSSLALALVLPALLLFGLPLAQMPSGLQDSLRDEVLSGRPHLVRDREDGSFLLAVLLYREPNSQNYVYVRADERGQPLPAERLEYNGWGYEPEHRYQTIYDPRRTRLAWAVARPPLLRRKFAGTAFEFDGPWMSVRNAGLGPRAAWLDQADGRVLAAIPGEEEAAGERWLAPGLARPPGTEEAAGLRWLERGGARFSLDTVPLWAARAFGEPSEACLFDRADRTAWRFVDGAGGPELAPVRLPGGERMLDVERVHGAWRIGVGLYEPYGVSDHLVLRGESGLWTWSSTGWRSWEPEPGDVLESELPGAIELRLHNASGDALLPHIEVLDARSGERLASHDYAVHAGDERLAWVAAQVPTLLRPPLASLAALRVPAEALDGGVPRPLDRFVLDPALAGGRRPWLALLGFGLALVWARSAWKHVGARPADRPRRLVWTGIVLALGLPALVALALLEPRRPAPKPRAQPSPEERARPLIWSAPRAGAALEP